MPMSPDYENLTERLFQWLPELRVVYEEEFSYWWDPPAKKLEPPTTKNVFQWVPGFEPKEYLCDQSDEPPGPHVVYGNLLNPLIVSLVMSDTSDRNTDQLERIFGLLEEMATSSDEDVRDVVRVTVCWTIVDDLILYERARPFMGPQTRDLCRRVEPYKNWT